MLDLRKWAAARARLEALKNNIPNWIDQERVNDYHGIVDALEAASGEDLRDFRIPPAEVKPRIASVQRGGFGGYPGRTNYTSRSYCDDGFFRRQIEGLWKYIQVVSQTQPRASSQSEVNYSLLSDDQLQELAINCRIPPARRVDERGEHYYFDRAKMIEALQARDDASSFVRQACIPTPHPKLPSSAHPLGGIFLCHSSEDKEAVRQLYSRLVAEGFPVWLDEPAAGPGLAAGDHRSCACFSRRHRLPFQEFRDQNGGSFKRKSRLLSKLLSRDLRAQSSLSLYVWTSARSLNASAVRSGWTFRHPVATIN